MPLLSGSLAGIAAAVFAAWFTFRKLLSGGCAGKLEARSPPSKVLTKATGESYLVTGGSGFVGSHIVEGLLARGEKRIVIFDLKQPRVAYRPEEGVIVVTGNLTDTALLRATLERYKVNTVFHVAAIVNFWSRLAYDYPESHQSNVVGTQSVIKACQDVGVYKLIYTSTCNVVFNEASTVNIGAISETTPYATNPPNHYTRTKTIAEKLVLAANGKGGLITGAVRPQGVFGPRDNIMAEAVNSGKMAGFKGVVAKQDVGYVENVVHGHFLLERALVTRPSTRGQTFNVSSGAPLTITEFYCKLAAAMDKKTSFVSPKILLVVSYVVEFLTRISHGLLIPQAMKILTPSTMSLATGNFWLVPDKAARELGYAPLYTVDEAVEICKRYYAKKQL
eukprot:TRINITY_DN8208_c0_g1_i1.p1 TRINITY_DN8208_c0_g1~~TRINITY_DN8208_c0_g1_i1.p1  ORF type:complete len:392 (+),score=71.98 TRINITY_DN8208_c0_g1_i1:29-1204(+)